MKSLPKREDFFKPVLKAIYELGGSGRNDEINNKVIELLQLPADLLEIQHTETQTKFEYEMAWVRTMLENQGYLENSARGIWAIKTDHKVDLNFSVSLKEEKQIANEISERENWKDELIKTITDELSPNAFERLVKRLLREKGFIQVEVTGRSGDGGIDGRGVATINGILSFHIIFQCKRYKGKVSSKEIRDFRGAMVGRTDKGLFITTGQFTRDAIFEASRDGAPAIDLMDGEKLAEKLKELSLGVHIEIREKISIDKNWFRNFENG
ncbi:restriction endonuclease [Fulvivirga lutea]|uniref:Restriction endonuclease n=1 Tax=Fulvivirga lutea TaxID=2810512 RepID=A0A974WKB0_9BACT|nr:restriction endonuclease [Fulvivirga lutea]QSE98782.1 restriction endonuclease [Fulvivirga lutea]